MKIPWKNWSDLEKEIGLKPMNVYFQTAFQAFCYDPAEKLLNRDFMRAHQDTFRFSDDLLQAVFSAEDIITASPALHFAACFLRFAIFENKKAYEDPYLGDFYPDIMGEQKGLFPMVIYCANTPHAYAQIVSRGLDVWDVAGNFASLNSFAEEYRRANGCWGLAGCGWNVICASEYLNTVGTLRFAPAVLGEQFTVYQNVRNGQMICLASEGIECSADGLLLHDATPAFVTVCEEKNGYLTAQEVSYQGRIRTETTTIDLKDWRRILGEGDTVLEYHIPTAPGYRIQNVIASFRKALRYFEEKFPEIHIRGFWSYSWLYCPQIHEVLAEKTSGILEVFDALRHVPVESGPECFHPFVFDEPFSTPVEALPGDTALRRGIKRMRMKGKHLCAGAVMMPMEEFEELERSLQ